MPRAGDCGSPLGDCRPLRASRILSCCIFCMPLAYSHLLLSLVQVTASSSSLCALLPWLEVTHLVINGSQSAQPCYCCRLCMDLCLYAFAVTSAGVEDSSIIELVITQPVVATQVFFIFAVVTNLLVSLSMLQGCVSVINTLTNINVYAISFLIPIGVVVYATIGGKHLT